MRFALMMRVLRRDKAVMLLDAGAARLARTRDYFCNI